MLHPDLIVIYVVGRSDLQTTCTKFHINILIKNEWDLPVDHGDDNLLSLEMLVTFVCGVCTNSSITKNCFGTGRCNHNKVVRTNDLVGDKVQL